jgi:hypothetical protein
MEVTNVMREILQPLNTIVAEVQFLQILQCFKIFDFSDAVRLQRKDFEVSQTIEILTVIASINVNVISETPPRASRSYFCLAKAPPG